MKVANVGLDNAYALTRGWVSPNGAASTGLISVTDETTGTVIGPVSSMTLVGQLLNDGGGGNLVVDVQAVLTEYTNNSGVDLVAGDVVVIDSAADLAVTTTTTAQDTRPVGIVLGSIGAGATGPVQTGGIVLSINVVSSVTRGEYAETSTTAKKATQNAARRSGSFGIYLEAGTTPAVLLFGNTDSVSSSLTVAEQDGTPSVVGVSTIKVPNNSLTDNTGGVVSLSYVNPAYGGNETYQAHGNTGSTETINLANGNYHSATLDASCTFTFTGATSAFGDSFLLELTENGSGGHTITWPGSVAWPQNVTPTHDSTAGSVELYIFTTRDGGTIWYGFLAGAGLTSASFAVPSITYGTPAAGSGSTTIRSNSVISKPAEADLNITNVTTKDVTSTAHGFAPVAPADATKFLNGAATPAYAQVKDSDLSTSNITTNNVSTSKHGFTPILPNDATKYLDGTGAYTVPAGSGSGTTDHEHIVNLQYNGDGATTAFELPAAPFDAFSVDAYVAGVRQDITMSGAMFTTMTFGSAPASGTNNIQVDIVAAVA